MTDYPHATDLSPLTKLVELGWKIASDYIVSTGNELISQFLAQTDDGVRVYMTPWRDQAEKDSIVQGLSDHFKEGGVRRYVLMTEVWMIHRQGELTDELPSEAPDRISALRVLGVDPGAGEVIQMQAKIIDGNGERHLMEREVLPFSGTLEGRMVTMLGPVQRRTVN